MDCFFTLIIRHDKNWKYLAHRWQQIQHIISFIATEKWVSSVQNSFKVKLLCWPFLSTGWQHAAEVRVIRRGRQVKKWALHSVRCCLTAYRAASSGPVCLYNSLISINTKRRICFSSGVIFNLYFTRGPFEEAREEPADVWGGVWTNNPFRSASTLLASFCQESYFLPPEETWAFYCELCLNLKCLFYLVI